MKFQGIDISPDILSFREKWFSSPESKRELKRLKSEIPIQYSELDPDEIEEKNGRYFVDISRYTPEWEDADTLLLNRKGRDPVAIRLTGIDAPEIAHPGDPTEWFRFRQEQPTGEQVLSQIRRQYGTDDLRVEIADPSKKTYGRYLGLIYQGESDTSLNLQFVQRGLAAALPFGDSGSDLLPRNKFLAAEHKAIQSNLGMWSDPFFSKFRSLSAGIGGRLTLNTLTDLTRLSENMNLAAAHEVLWDPGATDEEAYYFGRKLAPSYGRFFSGRGRAANTIEGLQHRGLAGKLRKVNTDFGSGYRGMFFDLETGGLTPSSSILQIGFKKGQIGSIWAKPEVGSVVEPWSRANILPHVPSQAPSEVEALRIFLGRLQGQTQLAGWNIGYPEQGTGFDIPFLLERAEKHGLRPQFETQLAGMSVRDIGHEAVFALGRGLEVSGGSVSKEISKGWKKVAGLVSGAGSLSLEEGGRFISEEAGHVRGWRLGLIHRALGLGTFGAHEAGADVGATERVMEHLPRIASGDAEFFSRWERYARADRLIHPIVKKGADLTAYQRTAEKLGLLTEFTELLGDAGIVVGKKVPENIVSSTLRTPLSWIARNPFHTAGIVAGGLLGLGYLSFSGRDDEYNTIEGLRHGGVAGRQRGENTDFGSGWKGIFGGIENFLSASKRDVALTTKSWLKENQISIQKNWRFAYNTDSNTILQSSSQLKKDSFSLGVAKKDLSGVSIYHEISEAYHSRKFGFSEESFGRFGSHFGPSVIVDEALMSLKMRGEEGFRAAWKYRREIEAPLIREHIGQEFETIADYTKMMTDFPVEMSHLAGSVEKSRETIQSLQNYTARVEKIYSTMEKNWLPKFADKSTADLTQQNLLTAAGKGHIEGLPHGGLSGELRKVNTEFGSGYDIARSIAKSLGTTFDDMIRNPGWRTALQKGKEISILGEGAFGKAILRETSFGGKSFQFVEKRFKQPGEDWWTDPLHESGVLKKLAHTPSSPSLYGHGDDLSIYMEYMPGGPAYRSPITKEAKQQLEETVSEAAGKGYFNPDLHEGNVLFDPITNRASIIDWGITGKIGKHLTEEAEMGMKARLQQTLSGAGSQSSQIPVYVQDSDLMVQLHNRKVFARASSPRNYSPEAFAETPRPVDRSTVKIKKVRQSQVQKAVSKQVWERGVSGGRGHLSRRHSSVV